MGAWITNPSALWWAALAIPLILVHLLKFKPRKLIVPSTRLWREVVDEPVANRFFSKVRRWRELLLQLLALFLLVLALAGFQIPNLGGPPKHHFFILDARASMLADHQGKTRFEHAKNFMARAARNSGPNDTFAIVAIAEHHEVLLDAGSSARDALKVIEESDVQIAPCSDQEFLNALDDAMQLIREGDSPTLLTAPGRKSERVSSLLGVASFGLPVTNRGIQALYLDEDAEGRLAISATLYAPKERGQVALVLERAKGEGWELLGSSYAHNQQAAFQLGLKELLEPALYRLRFSEGDAFPTDDQVHFRWQALPNLRIAGLPPELKRLNQAFSLESVNTLSANNRIREARGKGPLVSGVVQRMPSSWWQNVPLSRVEVEDIPSLELLADDTPLLMIDSKAVALLRPSGESGSDVVLSEALLDLPAFQVSNTLLALFGQWRKEQQRALVADESRSMSAGALLDAGISRRVEFENILTREAIPKAGEVQATHALRLAKWLLLAALLVILLEWVLYLRSRPRN